METTCSCPHELPLEVDMSITGRRGPHVQEVQFHASTAISCGLAGAAVQGNLDGAALHLKNQGNFGF